MIAGTGAPPRVGRKNPYVGPRAFRVGETLPNRQAEARELTDLLTAERVVLLHSPSGAGKTSLIQAAVIRMLEEDGFRAVGPVRVDKVRPECAVRNRYVFSIALYLLGDGDSGSEALSRLTLSEVLRHFVADQQDAEAGVDNRPPVLILDQFEEVLVLDPTDWDAKEQFFDDLREVLVEQPWWVLLAMREDYMGGLDRYMRLVPGHLRTTYRLDFLTPEEARAAAEAPAAAQGVVLEPAATDLLLEKLARLRVERPDQEAIWLSTPYVEPFQLQVACRRLWKLARPTDGASYTRIGPEHVADLDVDRALSRYYAEAVAETARVTGVPEGAIRDWFETDLITAQHFRSQTVRGPRTGGSEVLTELQTAYLVRSDSRGGTTWYELAHDRLIQAVLTSNDEWRRNTYQPWQNSAYQWRRHNRPRALLLSGLELRYAPSSRSRNLDPDDRDFLKESEEQAFKEGLLRRHQNLTSLLGLVALVELLVLLWLLL